MSDSLWLVTVLFLIGGLVAWFIYQRMSRGAELLRQHLDTRNRLLDKFGTAQEFLDFANTEAGHSLLAPPRMPTAPQVVAPAVLRMVQAGIVSVLVGGAFLVHSRRWQLLAEAMTGAFQADFRRMDLLYGLQASHRGLLFMALGLGLLIGGFIARAWSQPTPSGD